MRDSKEFPYASHNTFEDQLIDQRSNWFLVSQAFLMAVFAVMLQTRAQMGPQGWPGDQGDPIPLEFKVIHLMLPLLGTGMSFLVYHAIVAAYTAKCFWRTPLYQDSCVIAHERVCQMSFSTAFPIAAVVFSGYLWACLLVVSMFRLASHRMVDSFQQHSLYVSMLVIGGMVVPLVLAAWVMHKAIGLSLVRLCASSKPRYALWVPKARGWGAFRRLSLGLSVKHLPTILQTEAYVGTPKIPAELNARRVEGLVKLEDSNLLTQREKEMLTLIARLRERSHAGRSSVVVRPDIAR